MLVYKQSGYDIVWSPEDKELAKDIIFEIIGERYQGKNIRVSREIKQKVQDIYNEKHKTEEIEVSDNKLELSNKKVSELEEAIMDLTIRIYEDKLETEGAIMQLANLIGGDM